MGPGCPASFFLSLLSGQELLCLRLEDRGHLLLMLLPQLHLLLQPFPVLVLHLLREHQPLSHAKR